MDGQRHQGNEVMCGQKSGRSNTCSFGCAFKKRRVVSNQQIQHRWLTINITRRCTGAASHVGF